MEGPVDQGSRADLGGQHESPPYVALAPAEHRRVHGDDDGFKAGGGGPLEHVAHQARSRQT